LTVVELVPDGDRVNVTMTVERMHDDIWTERLIAGRGNELDNLTKALAARG
jgi:hypothetical protein